MDKFYSGVLTATASKTRKREDMSAKIALRSVTKRIELRRRFGPAGDLFAGAMDAS